MDVRNKEMWFKENNEVAERFELETKKSRDWKSVLYKVMSASVLNGTVNRDVIDYCYQWTGSYYNTDNGSHNTVPCNILLDWWKQTDRKLRSKGEEKRERNGR